MYLVGCINRHPAKVQPQQEFINQKNENKNTQRHIQELSEDHNNYL